MGEGKYIPNSFQTPNAHVDELMHLLSGDEYKLLSFATRHILGWQDNVSTRRARISLSVFTNGFTTSKGKHFNGCGLSKGSIIKNLKSLAKFKLLVPFGKPTNEGQQYELSTDPDIEALTTRQTEKDQSNKDRISKARKSRKKSSGLSDKTPSGLSDKTPSGLSDKTHINPQLNPSKPTIASHDDLPVDDKPTQQQMYGHIIGLFSYDRIPKSQKSSIGKIAKELREAGYLLDEVTAIYNHVVSKGFSSMTPATLTKYASEWNATQTPAPPTDPHADNIKIDFTLPEPPSDEQMRKWREVDGRSEEEIAQILALGGYTYVPTNS